MTKAQKRVAIAKDVLKQLAARKYKATPGSYFATGGYDIDVEKFAKTKKCEVCALGACFASCVKPEKIGEFVDTRSFFGDEINYPKMESHLTKYFTLTQLSQIESAFECTEMGALPFEKLTDAIAFGQKYKSATKRMKAIMQNIIDNKGSFVP